MDEPIEGVANFGYYSDPARNALLDRHIAVYRVGEVYGIGELADSVPEADLNKWFVSTLGGSPHAVIAFDIPLADSEDEAWQLAIDLFNREDNPA